MNALTPFDTDWKTPTPFSWKRAFARAFADMCYVLLRTSGWMAMTLLATFGVAILFFMMLGDFTAIGFFSQVANLGTHFVAADSARRAVFGDELFFTFIVAFGVVALLRGKLLLAIVTSTKGTRHG